MPRERVDVLVSVAQDSSPAPVEGGWRKAVRALLRQHAAEVFQEKNLQDAIGLLLGLSPGTEGLSTEERRQLAAQEAGFSPSYFGRRLERGYLEELSASLVAAHLAQGAEGSLRTAVDKLVRVTGADDAAFVQQALDCGLAPLLRLAQFPEEVRRDFRYRCELEAGNEGDLPVYQVRGDYSSIRSLPAPELEVVVCRTLAALRTWFDRPTVVSAEYAPLPAEAWTRLVASPSRMESRVVIDGEHAEPCDREISPDFCATTFRTEAEPRNDSRIQVHNRYMHERSCREMTIRLRNHFCFGSFEVELLLDDPDAVNLAIYDYIAGVDARDLRLYGRSGRADERDPGPYTSSRHARVSAGPDAVIWPGSGVHFSWHGS
ncbi:MAG: hypothetical protein ACOYD4_11820 [Solirubrobacterales bacterium]